MSSIQKLETSCEIDYISKQPPEILQMIFAHLSNKDLRT